MKAILMDGYGGPEVLRLDEIDDPVAGPGEVVVDIHATTVNPADWKAREGFYGRNGFTFPHVLGRDFSGVVRETGDGVDDLAPGDAVFGVCPQGADGAYAEAIGIAAALVAKKPASLSHAETACLALTSLTALVALEDYAKLSSAHTILVQAGAGGVGGVALQYGRHVGAKVITTASARNHDYVRGLGADEVIDYNTADFTKVAPPCDVVFDTVGGAVHAQCYPVVKPGGKLIHIGGQPKDFVPPRDDIEVIRPAVGRDRAHLERMVELVESGAFRPLEMTHMKLSETAAAHDISKAAHVRGKIILDVR